MLSLGSEAEESKEDGSLLPHQRQKKKNDSAGTESQEG